jgi:hypothetical protein
MMTTMSCRSIARCRLPGEGQALLTHRAVEPILVPAGPGLLLLGPSVPAAALICSGPGASFLCTDLFPYPSKNSQGRLLEGIGINAVETQKRVLLSGVLGFWRTQY